MNRKRIVFPIIALWLAIVNCNLPQSQPAQNPPSGLSADELAGTATALASLPLAAVTGTPTETAPQAISVTASITITPTTCVSTVVANSPVNVRSGPGTVYEPPIGSLNLGESAGVAGKNDDGTWWYINFPAGSGGHGWVSASVVTASCIPTSLAIIAAPPTPVPASGTCKDGYVHRKARPSDKVCVPPASKAQAEADNAAAESRKVTSTYGPDTCASGYVWREAFSDDHVCVDPAVRSQAAADNAAAASRWVAGAYGPHTCIAGFVWREATSGDDVCVTPDIRTQTAADNAAAASRKATSAYGPDTCISGYVWREAFSGDHVCVTPEVRNQVAADNAAAPSHTWP